MWNAGSGPMLWRGNGPGEGGCLLHNPHYDCNDDALPIGASFFAPPAERFLVKRGISRPRQLPVEPRLVRSSAVKTVAARLIVKSSPPKWEVRTHAVWAQTQAK